AVFARRAVPVLDALHVPGEAPCVQERRMIRPEPDRPVVVLQGPVVLAFAQPVVGPRRVGVRIVQGGPPVGLRDIARPATVRRTGLAFACAVAAGSDTQANGTQDERECLAPHDDNPATPQGRTPQLSRRGRLLRRLPWKAVSAAPLTCRG